MMQVLVVGSLLTSCVEDADVTAYLTEDQLSNVAQDDPDKTFSAAVAGMYSDMQKYYDTDMQHNYFGQKSFDYLTSLMGNDMIMTGRFGMSLYHYLLDYWQQNYTPTNNRWKEYYRVIANANNILTSSCCAPQSRWLGKDISIHWFPSTARRCCGCWSGNLSAGTIPESLSIER